MTPTEQFTPGAFWVVMGLIAFAAVIGYGVWLITTTSARDKAEPLVLPLIPCDRCKKRVKVLHPTTRRQYICLGCVLDGAA